MEKKLSGLINIILQMVAVGSYLTKVIVEMRGFKSEGTFYSEVVVMFWGRLFCHWPSLSKVPPVPHIYKPGGNQGLSVSSPLLRSGLMVSKVLYKPFCYLERNSERDWWTCCW